MSAVGYYQHLLLKLQQQYHLNLCGVVDFAHDFSTTESVSQGYLMAHNYFNNYIHYLRFHMQAIYQLYDMESRCDTEIMIND